MIRPETGTLAPCCWEGNKTQTEAGPAAEGGGCHLLREDVRRGTGLHGLKASPPKMHTTDRGKGITLWRGNLAAGVSSPATGQIKIVHQRKDSTKEQSTSSVLLLAKTRGWNVVEKKHQT